MFISAYTKERRNNNPSPSGERFEPTYAYEIDKKGMKELKINGQKDVVAEVQAHYEDTKIENIINRVVAGDTSVLRPNAIYEDISEMPNNFLDAMNQIKAMERTYNELPDSVKKEYPTIESYVQAAGTEAWLKVNGYLPNNTELITEEKSITANIKASTPNEGGTTE